LRKGPREAKEHLLKKYPSSSALETRRLWSQQFGECWCCAGRFNLQTHEIASKAQAPGRWADVRNYFRACGGCNCGMWNVLPESVQLALKFLHDPENYDREFVNTLRHRAANAISDRDVRTWITVLRANRVA